MTAPRLMNEMSKRLYRTRRMASIGPNTPVTGKVSSARATAFYIGQNERYALIADRVFEPGVASGDARCFDVPVFFVLNQDHFSVAYEP